MSPRRLLALLTLVVAGMLAIALPVMAGNYRPAQTESNGVYDGLSSSHPGNAVNGKKIFIAFCGRCHVMAAAKSKGTLGPNLDRDAVSYTGVINAVIQGVGGIQAEYLLRALTFSQIYDVAKFVTTHRTPTS